MVACLRVVNRLVAYLRSTFIALAAPTNAWGQQCGKKLGGRPNSYSKSKDPPVLEALFS